MPQLDAIRAFAVAAVLLGHYTPIWHYGDFGVMGVQCFFVLSGFLITGILLDGREYVLTGNQTRLFTMRQFYIRRFLRIFPVYYATLLACVLAGIPDARSALGWHMAYLTNVHLVLHQVSTHLNHFWSLSVEEQFYLIWPLLILFTPRRLLLPMMLATIALSPAFKILARALEWNTYARNHLLFSNLDSLGIGALLAYGRHFGGAWERMNRAIARIGLWFGLPFWILVLAAHVVPSLRRSGLPMYSHLVFAFLFAWIVETTAHGVGGWPGKVLSWKPLLSIGRVSYGIYLFHGPVIDGVPMLSAWAGIPCPESTGARAVLFTAVTLALAYASWHAMEFPINKLKLRFPYQWVFRGHGT